MARPGASKKAARDAWRRKHEADLRAACKASGVRYSDALNLLNLLTDRAKPGGRVSESVAQIAEATGIKLSQVPRALDALKRVGVLVTIRHSRSAGAGGGKGRPPVRQLSFLAVIEAATGDADGLGITQNDRALEQHSPRTNGRMTTHLSAYPHGVTSTDTPTRAANAEPATGANEGETDAPKGQGLTDWQIMVCQAVAAEMYALDEANGRTARVINPHAVRKGKARLVVPELAELQAQYPRLDEITPSDAAWPELLTVLACNTRGDANDCASPQAWAALDPYRLVRAD